MEPMPKFIIETYPDGDVLIIGKCVYHKQLVSDGKKVKGGGWWTLKESTFTLYGSSFDFGEASLNDIQDCINSKRVYTTKALARNLTDTHRFQYKNVMGEITPLSSI